MISLTATELPRFMTCNGSLSLGGIPPFDPDLTVTEEGNAAHWYVQEVFENRFQAEELIDRQAPNKTYITPSMYEHIQQYLNDLLAYIRAGCEVRLEVETSHEAEGFYQIRGRADGIVYNHQTKRLTVPDFKYGFKIVDPFENWTLISHAIGWIKSHPDLQVIDIDFKIYQPRPFHPEGQVRSWLVSRDMFDNFWYKLDIALRNPTNQLNTSQHCYKCPAITQCPAYQIASMNAIDIGLKAYDSVIPNNDLSWMLKNLKRAQEVLKQAVSAYEDLALHRLKEGQIIPSYSIDNSLGNTRWKPNITPELVQILTGVDCSKKELITPTQAKARGVSEETIKSLTERPSTGFKLVNVDASKKAEKLFGKK
jgi:hypothetical protein